VKRLNVDQLSGVRLNSAKAFGEKIEASVLKSSLNTGVTHQAASDPVVWRKGPHKIPEQLYTLGHVFDFYTPKNHNHNHNHTHFVSLSLAILHTDKPQPQP
jgi:hypothetical protein